MWREVEKFQARDDRGTLYPMVLWEWEAGVEETRPQKAMRQAKAYLPEGVWAEVPEVSPGLYLVGIDTYLRRV